MRSIKKSWLFSMLAFLLSACGNDANDARVYKLDIHDFSDWQSILEITDSATLQNRDQYVLTYANKCVSYGDKVYFNDYKAKEIYCFSKEGTLLYPIGRRGRAADEYVEVKDMWIDKDENTLDVLDDRSVICYDLNTGKYKKRMQLSSSNASEYFRCAKVGQDGVLFFSATNSQYSIFLDSPKGLKGIRENKYHHFVSDCFFPYGKECRVLADYGKFYIDNYEDGQLKRLYEFDLGSQALPEDMLPRTSDEFNVVDNEPKYFKCMTDAHETSQWLFVTFVGPNQTYYYSFINKSTGKYVMGKDLSMLVIGVQDDSFLGIVYPEYLPEDSYLLKWLGKKDAAELAHPVFVKFKIKDIKLV